MNRTPEPELMQDEAQALAYAKADFAEPHARFVALFRERFPDAKPKSVLDLGCGTADVTWRFAEAFPGAAVDGVDGSQAMLKFGNEAVAGRGLTPRVNLVCGYLPGAPLPRERYDAVISNSLLHHLADPGVLWRAVKAHAQPGGAVFVMDLMRPESEKAAADLVERYSGAEPEVLKRDFYNSLLAAYTPAEIAGQLRATGLEQLEVTAVSDRHLIVFGSF